MTCYHATLFSAICRGTLEAACIDWCLFCSKIIACSLWWYFLERQNSYRHNTFAVFTALTFFSSLLMFFSTSVNTFFVAILKVYLNCKRYPGLIMCNNQFELGWATKQAAATVIAGEKLIRNAGHGSRKPFVQVRQESYVSFSCQRHSLSSSIPCSNSFTGKHSNSTVLHCPTHRLIPTCCWQLIWREPGNYPTPQVSSLY